MGFARLKSCMFLAMVGLWGHVGALAHSQSDALNRPHFGIIDWFPFGWVEKDGPKGLMIDMVDFFDANLGSKSRITIGPVTRVIREMGQSGFDFTITYRDYEMMGDVRYIVDLGCLHSMVISTKRRPIHSMAGLDGARVAYPGRGYFASHVVPKVSIKRVEVPNNQALFPMAIRDRIDAFVINDAVWFAFQAGLNPLQKISKEEWEQFAEPWIIEQLPLSLSVSHGSGYSELAERMIEFSKTAGFRQGISAIYARYANDSAMTCAAFGPIVP